MHTEFKIFTLISMTAWSVVLCATMESYIVYTSMSSFPGHRSPHINVYYADLAALSRTATMQSVVNVM